MATQAVTDRSVKALAGAVSGMAARLDALESGVRASQLGTSSLEDGYLSIYDDSGVVRALVGKQADGTFVGGNSVNNPLPPPVPKAPSVTSVLAGLQVKPNGSMTGTWPVDFAGYKIYSQNHLSPTPAVVGTFATDDDVMILAPLAQGTTWDVWLTSVNQSGKESIASDIATGSPNQAVSQDILDGAINTLQLADGAVQAAKVAVAAIDVTKIADGAVSTVKIAAGAVSTAQLAVGAVTTTQIADGSISTPKIIAGAVQSASLATDSVSAGKIAADAVTAREVAATSIGATELAAGAVTAGKIAAGAVQAGTIAADAVAAGTVAANAITSRELTSLSVIAGKIAANAITATEIAAGSITAAKLQADLVVASRVIAGSPTGARVELHPTAGLQGFNAAGTRTLWLDSSTGNFSAIGSISSANSGTRIVINPGGTNPDTMRFYPGTGNAYASIDSIVSSANYAGIMMYGATSGTLRGIVIAREDYASLIYADPGDLFSTIKTDIFVSSGASSTAGRIRGYQFDMMADVDQGSDPGFRFMVTHGTTMISDTLLYYNNSRSGGSGHDEPHFAAVNNNVGITFADIAGSGLNERLWIVGNNVTQRKDLGVWSVVYDGVVVSSSSNAIKRNITPALDIDPRQAVRNAKPCYFQKNIGDEDAVYFSDGTLKRGATEAPVQFGFVAEDMPEVVQHNIGPILPGEPESLGISLDGLVTLLWQGQSDVHDRIDRLTNDPKWIPEVPVIPPAPSSGATIYGFGGSLYVIFASGKTRKLA